MLHEGVHVPVLMRGSEIVVWRGKGKIKGLGRVFQMDNHRGLLDKMRIN